MGGWLQSLDTFAQLLEASHVSLRVEVGAPERLGKSLDEARDSLTEPRHQVSTDQRRHDRRLTPPLLQTMDLLGEVSRRLRP